MSMSYEKKIEPNKLLPGCKSHKELKSYHKHGSKFPITNVDLVSFS